MKPFMFVALLLPAITLAQQINEPPGARAARFMQYCAQQPAVVQAQCRTEANAAIQQYTAQYNAAMAPVQQQQNAQNKQVIQNFIEGKK